MQKTYKKNHLEKGSSEIDEKNGYSQKKGALRELQAILEYKAYKIEDLSKLLSFPYKNTANFPVICLGFWQDASCENSIHPVY